MSGSGETTTVTTPATATALISVDIVRPVLPLDRFQDLLHCADRMGQGLRYLVRQSHPGSHVGGLARHDEAPARAAAHGVEHREHLVRCEAMRIQKADDTISDNIQVVPVVVVSQTFPAARQLGVSVKTVSRWVGGATEPRLRDLRRIRELFGEIPFT